MHTTREEAIIHKLFKRKPQTILILHGLLCTIAIIIIKSVSKGGI